MVADLDPNGEAIAESFARSFRDGFGIESINPVDSSDSAECRFIQYTKVDRGRIETSGVSPMKVKEIENPAIEGAARCAASGLDSDVSYLRERWPGASEDVLLEAVAILNGVGVNR